mmetsp:Transcript_20089/g.19387  ORF Transcript_20089/g.19387 Transcript_20089/m.19387 type:complete len:385 (+) Transcript_20089:170-1324(+)
MVAIISTYVLRIILLIGSNIPIILSNNGVFNDAVTSKVVCDTTKGSITIEVHRGWAPLGADRFIDLVKDGFFTDIAFFRCVERFLTQFGISDKENMKHWHNNEIKDDVNLHKGIQKNFVSFAGGGPNTRSTQLFIAFEYLDFLGKEPWETPFGVVVDGQATLDSLYKGYGDIPPFGKGVDQQKIHNRGNAYVRQDFPKTDFLTSCKVVEEISSMKFDHSADEAIEEKRKKEEKKKEEELGGERDLRNDDEISEGKREAEEQEKEEEEEKAVAEEEAMEAEEEETEAFLEEEEANDRGKVLNHVPRGPDELNKLAAFENKARLRKGKAFNNLRDQLKKSQNIVLDKNSNDTRVAFFAVGILSFFCGILFYLHRQRGNKTTNGKST